MNGQSAQPAAATPNRRKWLPLVLLLALALLLSGCSTANDPMSVPDLTSLPGLAPTGDQQDVAVGVQLLVLLTVLSLAPALLIMMTSFTRIIIVLSFLRNAVGMPQLPPNQVLIGLALFLTLFSMSPTIDSINNQALRPYLAGEIGQQEAINAAQAPIRDFMMRQTREKDIALFVYLSKGERPATAADVSMTILIPAFTLSELKTAFQMGVVVFIPFLVIDMVVASSLMSMGMMMLPPSVVSLPFKLLLFVMVDGWHLTVRSLMASFS
ncbi:MAG: flagellar type III secretion system pore protein FliP [Anaerolineae bacterium]